MLPNYETSTITSMLCSADAKILEIIRDDSNLLANASKTDSWLATFLDPFSFHKGHEFWERLKEKGVVFGWEMNVPIGDGVQTVVFVGSRIEDKYLIIITFPDWQSENYYDQIIQINNEQANILRKIAKQKAALDSVTRDRMMMEDMTRFNNELMTLQRELSKRNREIENQRKLLRDVFEMSPDIMYVYDAKKGRNIMSNRELGTVLGFSTSEITEMGATFYQMLVHPEDWPLFREHRSKVFEGEEGEVFELEYRISDEKGDYRWFSTREVVFLRSRIGQVSQIVGITQDITLRKKFEDYLVTAAMHDGLTGLYNRMYFDNEIKRQQLGRQYPISLIMADLDGLKRINDTYGHDVGDAYIIRASTVLRDAMRADDIVARLGGDEFAIILPSTNKVAADRILERIQKELHAHNKGYEATHKLHFSIGSVTVEEESDLNEALKIADERMYANKAEHKRKQNTP